MAKNEDADAPWGTLPTRGQVGVADVISALREHDGKFAAREQKVADFVKENLEDVTNMTIAKVAEAADVSTPTVIRFCRTLGCDGFREFKLRLAQNLAVSRQYLHPDNPATESLAGAPLDRVIGGIYSAASALHKQLPADAIKKAGHVIADCRYLVSAGIGGGSSVLAEEAANRFFRLGIPAASASDGYLMQMRAATLTPKDAILLFSASGEADAVIAAARVARSYGAETICLTRAGSRLAAACSLPILIEVPEDPDIFKPTTLRYAYLAALDALALTAAHKRPERTKETLRRIRASLTAYHGHTGPQPLGD
ncbi:MurR/RpiR family transcriptional regulator [Paracoccaceae bacterium GXU_MW_L88]